jgi:hypothetical protein
MKFGTPILDIENSKEIYIINNIYDKTI